MFKILFAAPLILIIQGCSSVIFGTGIEKEWGTGAEIRSHFLSYSVDNVVNSGNTFCSSRGLPKPTFSPVSIQGEYRVFNFECNFRETQVPTPSFSPPAPTSVDNQKNINQAISKCLELGLTVEMKDFAKCVTSFSK